MSPYKKITEYVRRISAEKETRRHSYETYEAFLIINLENDDTPIRLSKTEIEERQSLFEHFILD